MALEPEQRYPSWRAAETAIASVYEETVGYPVPDPEPTDDLSQSERTQVGWFYNELGLLCIKMAKADTATRRLQQAEKVGRIEESSVHSGPPRATWGSCIADWARPIAPSDATSKS